MKKLLFSALALLALFVSPAFAASNLTISTGTTFNPTSFALFQGSDFNIMLSAINTLRNQEDGTTPATGSVVKSTSATTCLSVGPNGATTPSFNVDCSTTSAVTGLNVKSAATGSGVAVTSLGGTNEPIFLSGKGTGPVYIGGTTSTLAGLQVAETASAVNDVVVTNAVTTAAPTITVGGAGADTNVALGISAAGTGNVTLGTNCTGSFSGNAVTCNGQRGLVTTASLSTIHNAYSTAQVVTDSSVITGSEVLCTINTYSGTLNTNGNPTLAGGCIVNGASHTISMTIYNADGTNALSGTVGIAFQVIN